MRPYYPIGFGQHLYFPLLIIRSLHFTSSAIQISLVERNDGERDCVQELRGTAA